jgi:hypothetical protein
MILQASLLANVLDRAAGHHDLVRTHRGVADENHLVVVRIFVQHVPGLGGVGVKRRGSASTHPHRGNCGSRNIPAFTYAHRIPPLCDALRTGLASPKPRRFPGGQVPPNEYEASRQTPPDPL